jgi:hypothetical protein
MTSDEQDDVRGKFRQAFRLFGEAAGEALRAGISRIDRTRHGSATKVAEPMRQAGAAVLRKHEIDKLLHGPDGAVLSGNRAELILRDIAAEVYEAMWEAAHRQDKPHTDAERTGGPDGTSPSASGGAASVKTSGTEAGLSPQPETTSATYGASEPQSTQPGVGSGPAASDRSAERRVQAEAVPRKDRDGTEETTPMPGGSI